MLPPSPWYGRENPFYYEITCNENEFKNRNSIGFQSESLFCFDESGSIIVSNLRKIFKNKLKVQKKKSGNFPWTYDRR